MAFRLASKLGCSVRELWAKVDANEFQHWIAFYRLEPWGYQSDNYHAALISSTVANSSGSLSEPVAPSFFMDSSSYSSTNKPDTSEPLDEQEARLERVLTL